ncbi:MAG: hypothetical protein RI922_1349 [Bacteroidota bacterium]|jgi:hypothetical protein
MLNRIFFFLIFSFLVVSCNKEKSAQKKIDGTWEIISYKRTEANGLNFYASVSGEMSFTGIDHFKDNSLYSTNIAYSFDTDNGSFNENGCIEIIDNGNYMNVIKMNSSNIPVDTIKYRILVSTKTDLQLEFSDNVSRVHNFIFKKKK